MSCLWEAIGEKGLRVLLEAWGRLRETIPLRIAGDGPLTEEIAAQIRTKDLSSVKLLGRLAQCEVLPLMHGARFLILPSVCYENFPLTIAEAFACGLPVMLRGWVPWRRSLQMAPRVCTFLRVMRKISP